MQQDALTTDRSDDGNRGLKRLDLLASALAGASLQVAPVESSEPAWTDGRTVYVDAEADPEEQIATLSVQASLLAAGSLEQAVVRRFRGRPGVARRYLAVEGHRALAANDELLPPMVRSMIDSDVARRTDSPIASLAVALSRETVPSPPASFGVIHARKLLGAGTRTGDSASAGEHIPRRRRDAVLSDIDEDDDGGDALDIFSSPVGGGGALGKFLQKMLSVVRSLGDGGPPGADAPTHRARSGIRGAAAVSSTAQADAFAEHTGDPHATTYPEWDSHRRRYRPDWCTVYEVQPRPKAEDTSLDAMNGYGLRRPLARLGMGPQRCHRQSQGDDIDIDAAVEAQVEVMAGSAPDDAVYLDNPRLRRDLAVLILLDTSGSVAEPGNVGQTVHEQQLSAAAALTVTLHDLGDRVALYAFRSHGRFAVQLMPVKRFNDHIDVLAMRRLRGLTPGAYSRLGAAIRHGTAVLERHGGTPRRLLVVLSDGLAYDHGYERVYGAADARRALAEAHRRGTGCLCLTIGAGTDAHELQRVFGTAAHATIPRLDQLSHLVGPLFRQALGSAELRRRVS